MLISQEQGKKHQHGGKTLILETICEMGSYLGLYLSTQRSEILAEEFLHSGVSSYLCGCNGLCIFRRMRNEGSFESCSHKSSVFLQHGIGKFRNLV